MMKFLGIVLLALQAVAVQAQSIRITGKVYAADSNQPLEGVSISIKGKTTGVQTNGEGFFSLDAQATDVLVITYAGYQPIEQKAGAQAISVFLEPQLSKLDEVVVVGYGTQSRGKLTGAVSSVDAKALQSVPRTNVATALQGTVSGLRVQQTTGQPGATPSISFRGGTNFNGSGSPLFIVDGVIVPSLYGINMEDVESIDVLKDAASTAIYGARASNGVVLVTTKRGKKGKTQVSYTFRRATNFVRRNPETYLNGEDYIRWNRRGLGSRFESAQLDNNTGEMNNTRNQLSGAWGWGVFNGWTVPDGRYSTQLLSNNNRGLLSDNRWKWMTDANPFNPGIMDTILYLETTQRQLEDMILQRSTLQEHNVKFAGANDQGNFALSLGAIKDVGIVLGSDLSRLNMNFNGGLNVGKRMKIGLNVSGYSVKANPTYLTADGGGGLTGGLIQRFGGIAPTARFVHDVTGEILPGVDGGTLGNPAYLSDKFINTTGEQRFSGIVNLEYNLLPGLKAIGSAGGFMRYTNAESFTRAYFSGTGGAFINTRNTSFSNVRTMQWQYNGFLEYSKDFGQHRVTVLGGGEYFEAQAYSYSAAGRGAATDFIPYLSAATEAVGIPFSGFNSWNRLTSAIGRVNYSYGNRFLATINARYDGTSRLSTYRYGTFPGVSVGWNMHNEAFWDKINLNGKISAFKPRLSWGTNGSIDPLGDFAAVPQYNNLGIYNGIGGFGATSLINTSLRWERATTFNAGFDLGLFNNRVTLIGDFFVRNVFDKLTSLPLPGYTGFTSFNTNLGQLQNKGVELEAKASIIQAKTPTGLSWDVSANVYHVKNYAVQLPDNGQPNNRQSTTLVWDPKSNSLVHVGGLQEGRRIGLDEVWAPIYDGIYRTKEELDAAANLFNSYLPHINKRVKMLGDARWRDVDRNDTIDFRDMVYVGRTTPTVMGGFSTSLSYKRFSLFVQTDYALGFVIVNQNYLRGMSQVQGSQNGPVDIKNTWHPDNPNGSLPRFYWANHNRNYFRDAGGGTTAPANFWQKGDYLMLREVTLSYDVPAAWLQSKLRNYITQARLYITGSNLHYFTSYNGTFPETGGNDVGRFPLPRTLVVGVNVNL